MNARTKHQFHHRHFRVAEYAFSARPLASYREHEIMRFTDIGPDGMLGISDGTYWRPVNGEALLGKSNIFIGIAPTFTARAGGAAGKVTFGTALGRTGGIRGYFYYVANSLDTTHDAGFYWTVMTDGTSGTVYADEYTPGTDPVRPSTPTAFPGTVVGGAGAITAVVAYSVTIPAGLMADNAELIYNTQLENNNNGDDKECIVKLGATALNSTLVTTATSTAIADRVWNASTGVQYTPTTTAAIDTTVDTTFTITLDNEVATSWSLLPYVDLVLRSA
jgi:hypothetical protein